MENEEIPNTCSFLKDPLSISDLINSGTNFEINTNFDEGFTNDIFDELNVGSDDELDDDGKLELKLASPWTKPFEELKSSMTQLNMYMWKNITKVGLESEPPVPAKARVCVRYNAYWEGEGAPFDSSFLRGSSYMFYTGKNEVLEGMEAAVCTMHKGEHAQFVISYHMLFHEMGCPPRVKPKADALFIIELVSYNLVGDIDAEQQLPEEDRNKYNLVIDKIKEIHLKGLDFFGQGLYRNSCRAFEKAVNILKFCRLANEAEEEEQKKFLLKLYTNLAVCYIKINSPSKTCIMCKEIRYLTNNNPPCKALFQEGRALLMLGEYSKARKLLTEAQYLEPQNQDINKELKLLEERYSRYKENERNICARAFGLMKDDKKIINSEDSVDKVYDLSDLEKEVEILLQQFKNDDKEKKFRLPPGLTNQEIETVSTLAKRLKMKLSLDPLTNNPIISKTTL